MGIYMLEHAPYKPPEEYRVIAVEMEKHARNLPNYNEAMRDFMQRVFSKSGISPNGTYLPPAINPMHTKDPKVRF